TVYLPPSYATDTARRFPVFYFLHDDGVQSSAAIDLIKPAADRLASVQGFSEPIIVAPDEASVAQDLVGYVDSHYRTLAVRISRGIAGHGKGGDTALRIDMQQPDVFSS